jgi:CrcB protein
MQASIVVFIGAGIGGLARHFLNAWVTALMGTGFPHGILAINVIGSTAMGLVAGWFAFRGAEVPELRLFLATGILGGFTTFSAFSMDFAHLAQRGDLALGLVYVAASVLLSIAAVFAGLAITRAALA